MEKGTDFLRTQVSNAVMQHRSLVEALKDHEQQAEDPRFRELCARHLPKMMEHQRMLEEYAEALGADESTAKKALGRAMGMARDLADAARTDDFLRLAGDIVMARQAEDTFKTFREAGKELGEDRLREIGDRGEGDHDDYVRDANRLIQRIFVERVRGLSPEDARAAQARGDVRPQS